MIDEIKICVARIAHEQETLVYPMDENFFYLRLSVECSSQLSPAPNTPAVLTSREIRPNKVNTLLL